VCFEGNDGQLGESSVLKPSVLKPLWLKRKALVDKALVYAADFLRMHGLHAEGTKSAVDVQGIHHMLHTSA
jgi:hypothetical protein